MGPTPTQDNLASSGQQDDFDWSDAADFLNDQMDCMHPFSPNQENQMATNRCETESTSTPSCSTQGDWMGCDPNASCVPAGTPPSPPPPLCRDFSNSSLCSILSFGSLSIGCD